MAAETKNVQHYLSAIKRKLMKEFPGININVVRRAPPEHPTFHPYAYYLEVSNLGDVDWYDVVESSGELATDALVETGYTIRIWPADNAPKPVKERA